MAESEENICAQCGKRFKHQRNLQTHEKAHNGTLPLSCCGLGFPSTRALQRHRCTVHGETKSHICLTCGKVFAVKDDLSQHQRREKEENTLECDICGHKVHGMVALRRHMSCHTEERKFVCDLCGAMYKQMCSLSRHKSLKH